MLAGAAGGAVGGAGFSGMATGWNGQAMLRGAAIGGAAGGAAGGFTGGFLFSGGDLGAGLDGAWNGFTNGAIIGGGTGLGMGYYQARRNKLNPWTGRSGLSKKVSQIAESRGIRSTQKKVVDQIVNDYLKQMMDGDFLNNPKNTSVGGFFDKGKYYFNDGNHRINAAIEYYIKTGNDMYIQILLNKFRATPYSPKNYGLDPVKLPTRL